MSRKSPSSGTDTAQGLLSWTGGSEDTQAGWDLYLEVWGRDQTNSFHRMLGWGLVNQRICVVACSTAQGHSSWLLALIPTPISVSEAEAVLKPHEKKHLVPSAATLVFLQMGPAKANTVPQSQALSGYRHRGCAHRGEMLGCATCSKGATGSPSSILGADPARPPAHPIPLLCLRYPGFASGCLSLCPCHCHRVVQITFSFIPCDTGCGHNKTHLIREMLRIAGRGNGSPHLVSARSGRWHMLAVALSAGGSDREGSSCVLGVQTGSSSLSDHTGAKGLRLPACNHPPNSTDGNISASPLSESWQTH